MDALPSRSFAPAADPRSAARQLADGVVQVLSAPRVSLEALRGAVVRYGRAARELAIAADDAVAALLQLVGRSLEAMPGAVRADLVAHLQWWTIHGYHRAD